MYVFRLDENVSSDMGQNSLSPYGEKNLILNFRLARDQTLHLETWHVFVLDGVKQIIFSQFVLFSSWEVNLNTK